MYARQSLPVAFGLLALTACFGNSPAVQLSDRDTALNSRWHASLASPADLAGAVQMNGSASMAPNLDSTATTLTLDLANASPGGQHPWAVHRGQCGQGQDRGVFGSREAYSPLNIDSDGQASGTALAQMATPRTGDYFVAVYASATNSMVIACGNLAPPTT